MDICKFWLYFYSLKFEEEKNEKLTVVGNWDIVPVDGFLFGAYIL